MKEREEQVREKVMISIRKDYLCKFDALVIGGAAPNRSALIEKIIGSFLQDMKMKRANSDTALGAFVGFLLLLVGESKRTKIFEDE